MVWRAVASVTALSWEVSRLSWLRASELEVVLPRVEAMFSI